MLTDEQKAGLAKLREPFPSHQISYLPKGGVKLAYVGHAALTDRLLDADPEWSWEPMSINGQGWPEASETGMWIKLTVCGVTRLGYGDAGAKKGGDAIKEIIGDALRNAAMRFGAALDLWHKGELHIVEENPSTIGKDEVKHIENKITDLGLDKERILEWVNKASRGKFNDFVGITPEFYLVLMKKFDDLAAQQEREAIQGE